MSRFLPALTLAIGLVGTFASAVGGRPWWVGYLALALINAGILGIEEGKIEPSEISQN